MNYLKKSFSEMEIDKSIAVLSGLLGLSMILVSEYYALNRTQIGLAILFSSLIYLIFRKKLLWEGTTPDLPKIRVPALQKVLMIIFIIFFTLSLISLHSQLYHRPPIFFIFITIACITISIQTFILDTKKYIWIILLEIFLVSACIRGSIFFEYPTVYGNDPFYHIDLVKVIGAEHYLPSSYEYGYSNFPVMHIEILITKLLTGLNYKEAFFVISIIEVLGTIFIYLLVKEIFNLQTGMLATLLLNISDYHIFWGAWIIPMTLGAVFFTIIVYLVFRHRGNKTVYKLLVLFLVIASVLTHTIAAFVTFIVLVSFFIFENLYSLYSGKKVSAKEVGISSTLVLFFGVFLIFYWMNAFPNPGQSFFSGMVLSTKNALTTMDVGSVGRVTASFELSRVTMVLIELGYTLLLFFSMVGILITFKNKDTRTFVLAGAVFVLLSLIYLPALSGVNFLLPARWFVFLYILITPFAGLAIFSILKSMKSSNTKRILLLSSIFLLIFFMITSTSTSDGDSPIYAKELGGRSGMLCSEVEATDFVNTFYSGLVSKNGKYQSIRESRLTPEIEVDLLNPEEEKTYNEGLIAVRKYDLKKGFTIPLFGRKGKRSEIILPTKQFYSHLDGIECHKIYENNEVQLYLNRDFGKED